MTASASRRLLATLALGATLLTGCGAGTTSSAPAGPAADRAGGNVPAATEAAKVPAGTANPQQTGPAAGPATDNRLLARTASITLQVPDVAAAAARLRVIAAGKGGLVGAENVVITEGGVGKPSTLVIVVPADRLDAALDEIGSVGAVKLRSINTTDVTTQVADLDARIRTQRESIARIQELLKKAGSVAEIAQVEGELTRRQADLESLLARQKAMENRVAESPITVTLVTPAMPTPDPVTESPSFWLGLKTGWRAFTGFVAVSLMVIGGFLPFGLFFGLVGVGIWWAAKRITAHRRARRPDPVWPTPADRTATSAAPSPTSADASISPSGGPQASE